ncbi:MAG: hypothetical protein KAZ87_06800 [Spirochaetes bacterium]|nr:hypothetical protein [Spirochaetota bacterium]
MFETVEYFFHNIRLDSDGRKYRATGFRSFVSKCILFRLFLLIFFITASSCIYSYEYRDDYQRIQLSRKYPRFRAAVSAFGMTNVYNDKTELYYHGVSAFVDCFLFRARSRSGNGFDLYARGGFKSIPDMDCRMLHADAGGRLVGGFYCFKLFVQPYVLGAARFQSAELSATDGESAVYGGSKNFTSIGIVGGGGIEIAFIPELSFFAEYNNGYTPVGKSKFNTESHMFYAGIAYRTSGR